MFADARSRTRWLIQPSRRAAAALAAVAARQRAVVRGAQARADEPPVAVLRERARAAAVRRHDALRARRRREPRLPRRLVPAQLDRVEAERVRALDLRKREQHARRMAAELLVEAALQHPEAVPVDQRVVERDEPAA